MALSSNSYLCGGIYLSLLIEAKKPRSKARNKFDGGTDGLSDQDILKGLIYIVTGCIDSTIGGSFAKTCSQYKSCQINGNTYIPFNEISTISSFNTSIQNKKNDLFNRVSEFINKYISDDKLVWLTKALLETIKNDVDICDNASFLITSKERISKKDFYNVDRVEISIFLTSVLQYILNHKQDNIKGTETFLSWFTRKNERQAWKFVFYQIGNSITQDITIVKTDDITNNTQNDGNSYSYKKELPPVASTLTVINIPEEQPSDEYPYSSDDKLLLQEFTTDYDEIMFTIIGENYATSLIDMTLPHKTQDLYKNKWNSKADSFIDPTLKSYVFGLLGELNTLSNSLLLDSSEPFFIKQTRMKIRNLYVKFHPDLFAGTFPYEAFIDDWDDGEFY